jgi:hypothetical protein
MKNPSNLGEINIDRLSELVGVLKSQNIVTYSGLFNDPNTTYKLTITEQFLVVAKNTPEYNVDCSSDRNDSALCYLYIWWMNLTFIQEY